MNLPNLKNKKVKFYSTILALVVDTFYEETYVRKYYRVIYEDNTELYF